MAAPLNAPVVNFDSIMNDYYIQMDLEWDDHIKQNKIVEENKFLISIGSGARDILVPAGLTSSNNSHISALVNILYTFID